MNKMGNYVLMSVRNNNSKQPRTVQTRPERRKDGEGTEGARQEWGTERLHHQILTSALPLVSASSFTPSICFAPTTYQQAEAFPLF